MRCWVFATRRIRRQPAYPDFQEQRYFDEEVSNQSEHRNAGPDCRALRTCRGSQRGFFTRLCRGAFAQRGYQAMLPAVFSMIRTIRDRLSPFGASARFSMGQIISMV
jgi:hypothetical protein